MVSFVRHSNRSKFSERTTCLRIRGLSMSPLYSENRATTGFTCSKAALNRPKRIFYSRSAALRLYQGLYDCFVDNRSTISRLVSY